MIRKYQNELMVIISLFVFLLTILYKYHSHSKLIYKYHTTNKFAAKLEDISTMKKLWEDNSKITNTLRMLKATLTIKQIEKFDVDQASADIILSNLTGSQLNMLTGRQIASSSIQITEIAISRDGNNYKLELKCKW